MPKYRNPRGKTNILLGDSRASKSMYLQVLPAKMEVVVITPRARMFLEAYVINITPGAELQVLAGSYNFQAH